jgi:hypothetical protein
MQLRMFWAFGVCIEYGFLGKKKQGKTFEFFSHNRILNLHLNLSRKQNQEQIYFQIIYKFRETKISYKKNKTSTCSAFIADQNSVSKNTIKTQKLMLKEQSFHPEFSQEQQKIETPTILYLHISTKTSQPIYTPPKK